MLVECGTQFIGRKLSEMNQEKLSSIKVNIPYKRAGNVIVQQEVEFESYAVGDQFLLLPLLSADGLRLANLPPELAFFVKDSKPVSARGPQDENFHIIQDAFNQMKQARLISSDQARTPVGLIFNSRD